MKGQNMEKKPIRHADRTLLNLHPQVMDAGDATTVKTIAFMAAVKQVARQFPNVKEGDQIDWTAELNGRTTVTRYLLDAAAEQLLQ